MSNTNQAVQTHKMVRGLKFRIWEVDELYYLCRENKDADQLRNAKSRFSQDAAHFIANKILIND